MSSHPRHPGRRYLRPAKEPTKVARRPGAASFRRGRTRPAALSGGQKRRLDLALGLIGRPELLYLDEPTTGFDPAARHDAWDLVRQLRAARTTILLTTHDMAEAQALADRVVLLSDGAVVAAYRAALPAHQRRLAALGRPGRLGRDRRDRGGPALPLGPEARMSRHPGVAARLWAA
jgi:energy-coupling factor transporter ATP-binding protein EcfA2